MSDAVVLTAEARDRVGKGSSRAIRRQGNIPAVIYGDNKDPMGIILPSKEVTMLLHGGGFMTNVMEIEVDGTKHKVLPKDFQLHPVKDTMMHVDFLRVSSRTVVTVEIPVTFINEEDSVGLKRDGVLNVVRHTIEVNCRADAIPENFEFDLLEMDIDDTIHASDVKLPDGVTFTITDRDFTIFTIAPPNLQAEEEDEAEAVDAGDVPASEQGEDPDAAAEQEEKSGDE